MMIEYKTPWTTVHRTNEGLMLKNIGKENDDGNRTPSNISNVFGGISDGCHGGIGRDYRGGVETLSCYHFGEEFNTKTN